MKSSSMSLFLPVALIAIGTGWLLTVLNLVPGINWIWVLCLTAIGFLTLAIGGLDKFTIVVGPIFIAAGTLSILRQMGKISFDVEVPILTILLGVLILLARSQAIPRPQWLIEPPQLD